MEYKKNSVTELTAAEFDLSGVAAVFFLTEFSDETIHLATYVQDLKTDRDFNEAMSLFEEVAEMMQQSEYTDDHDVEVIRSGASF